MSDALIQSIEQEIASLRSRMERLEAELATSELRAGREISREYSAYYMTGGFLLGTIAAMVSLLFNVVGSLSAGKNPLELIRIYLTFPLGQRALQLAEHGGARLYAVDDGVI